MLDTLLRFAPHKTRTERERQQADDVYKSGHSIRVSYGLHAFRLFLNNTSMGSSPRQEKRRLRLTWRETWIMFIPVLTVRRTIRTTGGALTRLQTH